MNGRTSFAEIELNNKLVAASSPLTESVHRLKCCEMAGFGAAILKTCADYEPGENSYPRKVVNVSDGFYADGSFESEIFTLERGLNLYEEAKISCNSMVIIPSVTAGTLESGEWVRLCRCFADRGAKLIQLDMFYLGTMFQDREFYEKLECLFTELSKESYKVMPKLNVNLDAEKICALMNKCGIMQVSLLDSIRKAAPDSYNLHKETTSFFGEWQFPKTMEYLLAAKKYNLTVCAGGGVANKEAAEALLSNGADLVQIASYVLINGFGAMKKFVDDQALSEDDKVMLAKEKGWCDCSITGICTGCGGCKAV